MRPRCSFQLWLQRIAICVATLCFLFSMVQCGGGGGGGGGEETIAVTGTVSDGTGTTAIGFAECRFADMHGNVLRQDVADQDGRFLLFIPADTDGTISCNPPGLPNLALFTVASTKGSTAGTTIQGEHVNPITTLVADIIQSEQASNPIDRKETLLSTINKKSDPDLNLLVKISSQMYASMLAESLDVDFGGGEGGSGGGSGGGVGGEGGDGGDASPISNAYCEFIANDGLKTSGVLYYPALADFMDDGMLNRSDLAVIADTMQSVVSGNSPAEIKAAFDRYFANGMGKRCSAVADANGNYFIETPPNVAGYVRCFPPDQQQLMLATYVKGHAEGEKLLNEDVTPTTTFFSHHIASQLSGNLNAAKENFLADTAGLGDVHILFTGDTVSGFELLPDSDPADGDTGLVAFGSTALFNVVYKNSVNLDYLSLLQALIEDKSVTPEALGELGLPADLALAWSALANQSTDNAGNALGTDLATALSKARLTVTVSDTPGGAGIDGATVEIVGLDGDLTCASCGAGNQMVTENGVARFEFTGVPTTPTEISLEIYGVAGYTETTATAQIVAVASVDLEVSLTGSENGESPHVSITSPTSAATYTSDSDTLSVSGSAADNVGVTQVRWSNDRGGSGTCSGTDTWSASIFLSEGQNVITITAEDGDGNTATDTLTVTYTPQDPALPSVMITSPTVDPTYTAGSTTLIIGGTAADSGGLDLVTWSNDRGGIGSCVGTDTWSASITLLEGVNVITVTAHDSDGNTSTDTITVTYVTADTIPPTVTITKPTSASFHTTEIGSVDIRGIASDAVGVTRVTWSNDRGGGGTCTGTDTWYVDGINLSVGSNVITVTAEDAAGNTSTDVLTVNFASESPTVTITSPTSSPTLTIETTSVTIGGTASDNIGVTRVSWSNNRGGSGTCSGTTAWSTGSISLYTGDNVITISASDATGNTGTDTLTVTFPGIEPPTVSITSPTTASTIITTASQLSIGGTASDNVGVTQVTWANSRGGSGTCSGTTAWSASGITLYGGANVITVTARDAVGSTATDTLTVQYDTSAPTVAISSPTTQSTYITTSTTMSIGGTAADDIGVTQVRWSNNRGGSGTCSGTTAWSAGGITLYDGTNVITVTATDGAGRTATDTLSVLFDRINPSATISSPTSSSTYTTTDSPLTIAGSASDNIGVNQVTWSNNRGGSGTCSGTTAWSAGGITLYSGTNVITVTAMDAAGNMATDTLTVYLRPDLRITSGSPSVSTTSVMAGMTVTLGSWTVRNQSDAAASGFSNGFYLSTNQIISTGDTYLTGNSNSSGLSANAQYTWGGPTLTIPLSTPTGYYYIGILVDRTNAVTEASESNNYVYTQRIYVYHLTLN